MIYEQNVSAKNYLAWIGKNHEIIKQDYPGYSVRVYHNVPENSRCGKKGNCYFIEKKKTCNKSLIELMIIFIGPHSIS